MRGRSGRRSQRAQAAGGALVLRNEDLDAARIRADFTAAMLEICGGSVSLAEGRTSADPTGPTTRANGAPITSRRSNNSAPAGPSILADVRGAMCTRQPAHRMKRRRVKAWAPDEPLYPHVRPPCAMVWRPVPPWNHGQARTGVFACPTARCSPLRMGATVRRPRPPACILVISLCGARTTCRPISSPAWSTMPRCGIN